MLNGNKMWDYLKVARLVPLSKNKGSPYAKMADIRPIAIKSHIYKIMERAVLNKIEEKKSSILNCPDYQKGF